MLVTKVGYSPTAAQRFYKLSDRSRSRARLDGAVRDVLEEIDGRRLREALFAICLWREEPAPLPLPPLPPLRDDALPDMVKRISCWRLRVKEK